MAEVLVLVETTEACTTCGETFTDEEQRAFDPNDNDHCPKCGGRWCLTTYYGDPEYQITECQLGEPREVFKGRYPIPMILHCPKCSARHIDAGDFATKPHHTHACQSCGFVWRPAVVDTVGVQFLPGFKDEVPGG